MIHVVLPGGIYLADKTFRIVIENSIFYHFFLNFFSLKKTQKFNVFFAHTSLFNKNF